MPTDFNQAQQEWRQSSPSEKTRMVLALIVLIAVFLPWISISFPSYGGIVIPGVVMNGFHSYGMLTFLGAAFYVLWKILPMLKVQIPNIAADQSTITKILGLMMLAGPVIWLLQMGTSFSGVGIGLWICLVASAVFVYMVFTGKTLADLRKKNPAITPTATANPPEDPMV